MAYFLMDPSSKLDFRHDWSDWLAEGDLIATRQWSIIPMNGTSPETPILLGATSQAVVVTGLQAGKIYHLTEHITTSAALEADRTIVLRCEDT